MQPVAPTTTTGQSTPIRAWRIAVGAPQPGHMRCPCVSGFSFFVSSFMLSVLIFVILFQQTDEARLFAVVAGYHLFKYRARVLRV